MNTNTHNASTAAATPTQTPMEFPKGVLFSSIIDNESPPKSAVKTRKWLMTINFDKPQTERDALFVQGWIETQLRTVFTAIHRLPPVHHCARRSG